jgi:glycogen(starch) synthase
LPRLLILSAVEITRDPRARRSVRAADRRGWEVLGVAGSLTGMEPIPLDGISIVRLRSGGLSTRLRKVGLGGARPASPVMRELRGVFRLLRLARLTIDLVRAGRKLPRPDVVHANEIDALPASWYLASRARARLVYDAHELYARAEVDAPKVYWRIVGPLEGVLARRSDAVITVSEAIADELQRSLKLARTPITVINATNVVAAPDIERNDGAMQVVYQGTMAAGRPLEDLLDAAAETANVKYTIRVAHAVLAELRREVERRGLAATVAVVDPVAPDKLVEALLEFDVGLILGRPVTRNDELGFPNKLYEYMMAGLAIVAAAHPGVTPFIEELDIGATYEPGNPTSLAKTLEALDANRDGLLAQRRRARTLAVERFNAEAQEELLARAWRP